MRAFFFLRVATSLVAQPIGFSIDRMTGKDMGVVQRRAELALS